MEAKRWYIIFCLHEELTFNHQKRRRKADKKIKREEWSQNRISNRSDKGNEEKIYHLWKGKGKIGKEKVRSSIGAKNWEQLKLQSEGTIWGSEERN